MIGFKPKNDHDNQNLHSDIKLYYCAFDGCETNKFWGPGMIDHYKLFIVLKDMVPSPWVVTHIRYMKAVALSFIPKP